MAEFRISGVWKDDDNVITHYAFHEVRKEGYSRANKISKPEAISLLRISNNKAYTWLWSYKNAGWVVGEEVIIVEGQNGKYLRSNPDNTLTDNLAQLINFDWISR